MDVNILNNDIRVKARLLGYDEEFSIGWRDAVLIEEYYRIPKDGSAPGQFYTISNLLQERATAYLRASVVGKPCDPKENGWKLNEAVDVREEKFTDLWHEAESDTIYLIEQKENFTLYGKGDLERMLLQYGGAYTEIHYPYISNYGIAPMIFEQDYDGDGQQELAIRLHVLHGTGVSIDTLLMADREEEELFVYRYPEEEFFGTINSHLTYERREGEQSGLQAYLDGVPVGSMVADEEGSEAFSSCTVGSLARFEVNRFSIKLWTALEFWAEGAVIASGNETSISADVVYQGNGEFSLENFEVHDTAF